MSNNMDGRFIGEHCFTALRILCVCCVVGLLVSGGCGQSQQRSVDLYVDAVMFKELNENE
jgi:hypothetical protein